MTVFEQMDAVGDERTSSRWRSATTRPSGLRAIVAIHSTALGPALGGTRFWPYATEAEALTDVCRLARGMTYKHAAAGLDQGGGKAVIWGDPDTLRIRGPHPGVRALRRRSRRAGTSRPRTWGPRRPTWT